MFDANTFMSATYNEQTSTQLINPPEGEYPAVIEKITPRQITTKDGERIVMDVNWDLQDTQGTIEAVTGRKKNTARQTLWLDITPEGHIDMGPGKSIDLGRLREETGQNTPGVPWSPAKLVGCPATVIVRHKAGDGDKVYANVVGVRKL